MHTDFSLSRLYVASTDIYMYIIREIRCQILSNVKLAGHSPNLAGQCLLTNGCFQHCKGFKV